MTDIRLIASRLVGDGRGILAADESIRTMSARLEAEGIAASPASRRDYRELLLTAPGLGELVSGVIWCAETFEDRLVDGTGFGRAARDRDILPGIKVDTGTVPLPLGAGATITEGLDGLSDRMARYAAAGAAFAKWRAVIDLSTASPRSLEANAHALARYAAACQEAGVVPIVEPEVLCTGGHSLDACADVTRGALLAVFDQLVNHGVDLSAMVLKPNLVTPGLDGTPASPTDVAEATRAVLIEHVPTDVAGIAFLSGGHPADRACAYLSALNDLGPAPWPLTFSFGRALVSDALHTWGGRAEQVAAAQAVLLDRCRAAHRAASRTPQPV